MPTSWIFCWWYWTQIQSTVQRIDYADDTATALAKGPLSVARGSGLAGMSPKQGGLPKTEIGTGLRRNYCDF